MKKYLPAMICTVFLGLAQTGGAVELYQIGRPETASFGPHLARVMGGDVIDDSNAWGVQVEYQVTSLFSAELSGTFFDDSGGPVSFSTDGARYGTDLDVRTEAYALSARAGLPVTQRLTVYGGGGADYYRYKADGRIRVDESTLPELFEVTSTSLDISADDEFGFHLAAGLQLVLGRNVLVFAEYRHVFIDRTLVAKGSVISQREQAVRTAAAGATVTLEEGFVDTVTTGGAYDHGMVRAGLNVFF